MGGRGDKGGGGVRWGDAQMGEAGVVVIWEEEGERERQRGKWCKGML